MCYVIHILPQYPYFYMLQSHDKFNQAPMGGVWQSNDYAILAYFDANKGLGLGV